MAELTKEQFIELVKKSETEALIDIKAYKTKLVFFAFLGYAVIFGLLTGLILLVGGTISIALLSSSLLIMLLKSKIIFAILIAIWTFTKALWVKFYPPTGYKLKRTEFPKFFQEIDELSKKLKSLKIHHILLDNSLNSAVIQHPRLGVFGGQSNILIVGIQLLLALTPEQMRAVLAHELGHLSGNHSQFSGWIYRIRMTWYRLKSSYEDSDSFGTGVIKSFFDWYAPRFAAYSFALARSNEYEADQISANLTSPETTAKMLVNIHAKAPLIEREFWNNYLKQAELKPAPETPPFISLSKFFKNSKISQEQVLEHINIAMKKETQYDDTHPSLQDRIQHLKTGIIVPENLALNAAENWLESRYSDALSHFDNVWLEQNNENWHNRYQYVQESKELLTNYQNTKPEELDDENLWRFACTTEEFGDDEAALPIYLQFQKRHPENVGTAYCVGRILAAKQDLNALPNLRIALNNSDTITNAAQLGYQLLLEKQGITDAEAWWSEATTAQEMHEAAEKERSYVSLQDDYILPTIDPKKSSELQRQLLKHKNVKAAWLAQKVITLKPEPPVFIIAIEPDGTYWTYENVIKNLTKDLQVELDLFVVCLKGETQTLAKKIKKIGIKII